MNEFDLIRTYFTHPAPGALLGVGDDAALLSVGGKGGALAISTDMLVAGRHFFPDADPRALGHKALAVNLSDMAAMGATPRWATLSLALPEADPAWLASFAEGFWALARRFGVELVGGDTTRGPLNICVTILGEVPARHALRRDAARPGDDIWVSGHLGNAALALAAFHHRLQLSPRDLAACLPALHTPEPRVSLGLALRGIARGAIDVSDGLLADLGHIAERSAVAAVVEWRRLPRSPVMERHLTDPVARVALVAGGDDYELCFTAGRRRRSRIEALSRILTPSLTRIGRVEEGSGVRVVDADGRTLDFAEKGFDHFR